VLAEAGQLTQIVIVGWTQGILARSAFDIVVALQMKIGEERLGTDPWIVDTAA
jgi:hypothetical protein